MKLHKPVLLEETLKLLDIKSGEVVIDLTAGYGGHAEEILGLLGVNGRLILVDRDLEAISALRSKFQAYSNVEFLHSNFLDLNWSKVGKADRILMDLGVSSPQLDQPQRGFSFSKEAKLDMRMDQSQALSASQVVNEYTEEDLANLIYQFGEEPRSRQIARAIVTQREVSPIETTKQLANIVSKCLPANPRVHPATRTFQAIRILVNQELENLTKTLPQATRHLNENGRLAVISFHSLEDRIVKQYFKAIVTPIKDIVTGNVISSPNFRLINKKPIKGSINDNNPRARSAKLRLVEKIK